jgi:hypothetical protein
MTTCTPKSNLHACVKGATGTIRYNQSFRYNLVVLYLAQAHGNLDTGPIRKRELKVRDGRFKPLSRSHANV